MDDQRARIRISDACWRIAGLVTILEAEGKGMQPRWEFEDKDLRFLVGFFMPQRADVDRVVAMLREDESIVDGMVADPALADHLIESPDPILDLSPQLLFAVLLIRAREDLQTRPFTFEKSTNRMMVIFDTKLIVELLAQKAVLVYLSRCWPRSRRSAPCR